VEDLKDLVGESRGYAGDKAGEEAQEGDGREVEAT
jgi:hypothetical protein